MSREAVLPVRGELVTPVARRSRLLGGTAPRDEAAYHDAPSAHRAAGMFSAPAASPPARLVVTLLGLGLACGGASAVNHVLDRDIDRRWGRARARGLWLRGGGRVDSCLCRQDQDRAG